VSEDTKMTTRPGGDAATCRTGLFSAVSDAPDVVRCHHYRLGKGL
jgi:hypothetical protein